MHSYVKLLILITASLATVQLTLSHEEKECPPQPVLFCPRETGTQANACQKNDECEHGQKCCPIACKGNECTKPVVARPGKCPTQMANCSEPQTQCTQDDTCPKNQKCCQNFCVGLGCTQPVFWFVIPVWSANESSDRTLVQLLDCVDMEICNSYCCYIDRRARTLVNSAIKWILTFNIHCKSYLWLLHYAFIS